MTGQNGISFAEAARAWFRIGVLSFGGPTAQIALMHRVVVDEKRWLDEKQFLSALSFCMLLPGPEAMQLATYVGWRLHGVAGGLVAGLFFVLPGALVVLGLAYVFTSFGDITLVDIVFQGIQAAVVVIVIEALLRICKRALKGWHAWLIAGLSFIGIFFLALPFPLIILAAAAAGAVLGHGGQKATGEVAMPGIGLGRTAGTIALWGAVWWVPVGVIAWYAGADHILTGLGLFFSKLAVVTFGGAYAVLAYMAQDVVQAKGWLDAGEMMIGLGLAETTPGPLILVTEFVGYVAAFNAGGTALAVAGAAVVLWVTFVPCFLWIFVGAPYIDWIASRPRLRGALNAITAAVVGVILNLSIWFALHVYFATVYRAAAGPAGIWLPDPATIRPEALILSILSGYLLIRRGWSIQAVLAAACLGSVLLYALTSL